MADYMQRVPDDRAGAEYLSDVLTHTVLDHIVNLDQRRANPSWEEIVL